MNGQIIKIYGYTFKSRVVIILIILLNSFFAKSQCYTTSGNTIFFQSFNHSTCPEFTTLFILTDYRKKMVDTSSTNSFSGRISGIYFIYGVNYLTSENPDIIIGESILSITGNCIDISAPFEILICPDINDCDTYTGSYFFNYTGNNQDLNTIFVITDINKTILKIENLPAFSNISDGLFLIFAINYIEIEGLSVGQNLNELSSKCFDISNPLVVRSCESCSVFLGEDFELCFPQNVLLTASSGNAGSFSWNTGQNGPTINVSPQSSTTYIVTFTAVNGCQVIDSIRANINLPPLVDAGLDKTICYGQTVNLSTEYVNGASYLWSTGNNTRSIDVSPLSTQNFTITVTLGECSSTDMVQIIVQNCGSITGLVWEDTNANGIFMIDEQGIAGVGIRLLNEMGEQIAYTFSDMNGIYSFLNIIPGEYFILFDRPAGFQSTVSKYGNDPSIDSDANEVTGLVPIFSVNESEIVANIDAGYYRFGSIGDFVWEDENKNGIQDIHEEGISNVIVTLSGIDGKGYPVMLIRSTNEDGFYLFEGIIPGNYFLQFELPDEKYKRSPQNVALDDAKDSDANDEAGITDTFILPSGEENFTIDAGFYRCSYIGDYVWLDIGDESNVQDAGDIGLDSVIIYLHSSNNPGHILSTATSFTFEGLVGYYQFEVCEVGNYFISISPNSEYDIVQAHVGDDENSDSDITDKLNGESNDIPLTYALTVNNVDIGFSLKPLPIELLYFTGKWNKEAGRNELEWMTISEINTDYFEIFRSVNETPYEPLNKVMARVGSNSKNRYKLNDNVIQQNGSYVYKLKSYDFDGRNFESKPIEIKIYNKLESKIDFFPNPAGYFLNLHYSGDGIEYIAFEILDIVGTTVYQKQDSIPLDSSEHITGLDISQLPNGVYVLKVTLNSNIYCNKLVIQK